MQKPRVLFFIAGAVATEEEQAQADSINADVCLRNSALVGRSAGLEQCKGVAGCAPEAYVKKFGAFEGAPISELENDRTSITAHEAQKAADEKVEAAEKAAKEAEVARQKEEAAAEAKRVAAEKAAAEAKAAEEAAEMAKLEAEEAAEKEAS